MARLLDESYLGTTGKNVARADSRDVARAALAAVSETQVRDLVSAELATNSSPIAAAVTAIETMITAAPPTDVAYGAAYTKQLVKNPRVAVNATGYQMNAGTGGTAALSRVATGGPSATITAFNRMTFSVAPTGHPSLYYGPVGGTTTIVIGVTAGVTYTASAWARATWTSMFRIALTWRNASGAAVGSDVLGGAVMGPANSWRRPFLTAKAPVGATDVQIRVQTPSYYPGVGDTLDATGFNLTISNRLEPYIDGAQPNSTWDGTADASTSQRLFTSGNEYQMLNPVPRTLSSTLITNATNVANLCAARMIDQMTTTYGAGTSLITAGQFGEFNEANLRRPATVAFCVAAMAKFGIYDGSSSGISLSDAKAQAKRIILSMTALHIANNPGTGWGGKMPPWTNDVSNNDWQGALWTHFVAHGAWFIWSEFSQPEKDSILAMVTYGADRFLTFQVPYWQNRNGAVLYDGDSKAEEAAWNAAMLTTALIMQPQHANAQGWMAKFVELSLSVGTIPSDLTTRETIHGEPVADLINGFNLTQDGIIVNRGYLNPRYSASLAQSWFNAALFAYEGRQVPAAALRHGDLIYKSMMDFTFTGNPWLSPGGSYYVPASFDTYYPLNPESYDQQMAPFAAMDCLAHVFGLDRTSSTPAGTWAVLHAGQLESQVNTVTTNRSDWQMYHAIWMLTAAYAGTNVPQVSKASVTALTRQNAIVTA